MSVPVECFEIEKNYFSEKLVYFGNFFGCCMPILSTQVNRSKMCVKFHSVTRFIRVK